MTKINASSKWDEPITEEVLEQAIERGRKRLPTGLQFTAEELEEESEILKAFEVGTLERITYAARISQ